MSNIQVDLYLYDCWQSDWNENNWYDNVSLFTGTTPPSGVVFSAHPLITQQPGAPYFYPEANQTSYNATSPSTIVVSHSNLEAKMERRTCK